MKHKSKELNQDNQGRMAKILKEIHKVILNNNKFLRNKEETFSYVVSEPVLMTILQLFWKMFVIQFQKL